MGELTRERADRLITTCDKYAYHELVAYAEGITIGELREWLELGAVVGEKDRDPQKQELRRFTREYCRTDAVFSQRMFDKLKDNPKQGGDARYLWTWFERRWPCGSPLAIGSLLSGQRVEELALEEALDNPNAQIQSALQSTGYFREDDLDEPNEQLRRALDLRGWKRAEDAGSLPGPAPSQ